MLCASTHSFLNHPQYRGRMLVVGFTNEVPHPLPYEGLYLGVIGTVIQ
jgi:hypothetical protein